jgi:hypothetical protein
MPFPVPIPVPIPVLTASPPHAPPRAPARARRSSRGPQLGYHPTASTPQLPSVPVDSGRERTHVRRDAKKCAVFRRCHSYALKFGGAIGTHCSVLCSSWEGGRWDTPTVLEYTSLAPSRVTRPRSVHPRGKRAHYDPHCPAPVVMLHDHVAALPRSATFLGWQISSCLLPPPHLRELP